MRQKSVNFHCNFWVSCFNKKKILYFNFSNAEISYLKHLSCKPRKLSLNVCSIQGCNLAFLKAKPYIFGLFLNCLPEMKWLGYLAIFWPPLNVEEKS